jgi:hypothetical protein
MTAMDAIEDAYSQPGFLQVNFLEREGMSHLYKRSQRRALRAALEW